MDFFSTEGDTNEHALKSAKREKRDFFMKKRLIGCWWIVFFAGVGFSAEEKPESRKRKRWKIENPFLMEKPDGTIECTSCGKRFTGASQATKHTNLKHAELFCDYCSEKFEGTEKYNDHKYHCHSRHQS